jgi:hypothetical protein
MYAQHLWRNKEQQKLQNISFSRKDSRWEYPGEHRNGKLSDDVGTHTHNIPIYFWLTDFIHSGGVLPVASDLNTAIFRFHSRLVCGYDFR